MGSPPAHAPERSARFSLRPSSPTDAPFFAALYAEGRREEVAGFGWPAELVRTFLGQQHGFRERGYQAQYPRTAPEVIEAEGRAIGRLWVSRNTRRWVLVDVAVAAELQGRGIGTAVIEQLQAEARAAKAHLHLSVVPGSRARALYARLGFTEVHADPMYVQMEWRPSAAREDVDAQ